MGPSPDVELVEVQLELEHHAIPRKKLTREGFTHDWTVRVRGPDDCRIQEFIEKVVFNLHPDFPNHQRAFKLPPYEVSESGYAGFELPIDIYFKNKEEPKKITYLYDLCLLIKEAVRNTRREKLTFQNPSLEFKKKLLGGGGRIVGGKTTVAPKDSNKASIESSSSSITSSKNRGDTKQSSTSPSPLHRPPSSLNVSGPPEGSTTPSSQKSVSKNHSSSSSGSGSTKINHQPRVPGKDIASTQPPSKGSSSSKDKTSVVSSSIKSSAKSDPAFTDLFGPPIQTRPSPDTTSHPKVKTEGKGERTPSSSSSSSAAANKRLDDIKPDKNDLDKKLVKSERIKTETTEEIDTKKIPKTKATDRSRSKERDKGSKKDSSKKSKKRSTSSSSSRSSSSEKKDKSDKHKSNPDAKRDDKKSKLLGNERKSTPNLSSSSKTMPTTGASPSSSSSSSHKRKEVKKETFLSTKLSFNTSNNGVAFEIESIHSSQEKRWDSEKKSKKSSKNSSDIKEGKKKESSPTPPKASKTDKSYDRSRDKNSSPTDDARKRNGDTVSSSRVNGSLAEDLQLSSSESDASSRDSSQKDKESNRKSKKRKKSNKKRSKRNDDEDGSPRDSQSDVSSQDEDDEVSLKKKHKKSLSPKRDASYLKVLYWIRGKIDDMNDPDTLSRIVHEIESSKSGCFQVTDSSYNFDLLKLDDKTVERLKEILEGQEI